GDRRLGGAVGGVGLAQSRSESLDWVGYDTAAVGVGEGMALEILAAARAGEARLVGKVAVDGHPSYPGALGDLAHGCRRRPDPLVQLDRGLDDPLPGLVLALGATLELIAPAHSLMVHIVPRNLTRSTQASRFASS